ncbi:GNAT family N-acetyltransferase [Aquimarina rhabdastrellae]
MEQTKLRKLTIDDVDQLQKIGIQTFSDTFSPMNTEENMKRYLDREFSLDKLKTELVDKNSEFYFVELENKVIGYLKVNLGRAQTEIQNENTLEIQRIYVLKDFYGKKIGQLMYEKAIAIAKQKKVDYVWLGVWEENHRAISFYKKNGFKAFDKHIFKLGDDEQTDIMMKLEIKA